MFQALNQIRIRAGNRFMSSEPSRGRSRSDAGPNDLACAVSSAPVVGRAVFGHGRLLKWFGTATGIAGALMVALHIPLSGLGFILLWMSSMSWTVAGRVLREPSIVTLNVVFTAINVIGMYRWLFLV